MRASEKEFTLEESIVFYRRKGLRPERLAIISRNGLVSAPQFKQVPVISETGKICLAVNGTTVAAIGPSGVEALDYDVPVRYMLATGNDRLVWSATERWIV
jgi:hypothetical protein